MAKIEEPVHMEAFEYFFLLGGRGSQINYGLVAEEFGVGIGTIQKWSKAFKWKSRAAERKVQFKATLKTHTDQTLLSVTDRYRDIISRAVDRFDTNLKAGLVPLKRIEQFTALVKLDMQLAGQNIGGSPITVNIITAVPRPGDRNRDPNILPQTLPQTLPRAKQKISLPPADKSETPAGPPEMLNLEYTTPPEGPLADKFIQKEIYDTGISDPEHLFPERQKSPGNNRPL